MPDTSGALKAGLKVKDRIAGINGKDIKYFDEIKPLLLASSGDTIKIKVIRDEKPVELLMPLAMMVRLVFFRCFLVWMTCDR
jgi:membrane-associated protease RseP (regulator of RpoE activity)